MWGDDGTVEIDIESMPGVSLTEKTLKAKFITNNYSFKGGNQSLGTSKMSLGVEKLFNPLKDIKTSQENLLTAFSKAFKYDSPKDSILGSINAVSLGISQLQKVQKDIERERRDREFKEWNDNRKAGDDNRLASTSKADLIRQAEKKQKTRRDYLNGDKKNYLTDFILNGSGSGGVLGWLKGMMPRELLTGFEWLKDANKARIKTKMKRQGMDFDEESGTYKHNLTWFFQTRQQLKDYKRKDSKGLLSDVEKEQFKKLKTQMRTEMPFYIEALEKAGLISRERSERLNRYAANEYDEGLKEQRLRDFVTQKEAGKQAEERKKKAKEVRKSLLKMNISKGYEREKDFGYLDAKNLWARKIEGKGVLRPQYNGESWSTDPQKQGFTEKQGNTLTKTLGKLTNFLKPGKKEDKKNKGLLSSLSTILLLKNLFSSKGGLIGGAMSAVTSIIPGLAGGGLGAGLGKAAMAGLRFLGPVGLAAGAIYGAHELNKKYDWSGKIAASIPTSKDSYIEKSTQAINAPDTVPPEERYKLARQEYLEWEEKAKNPSKDLREKMWTTKLKGYGFKDLDHTKVPIPVSEAWWKRTLFGENEPPDVIKSYKSQSLSEERNRAIVDDSAEKRLASEGQGQNITNINAPVTNITSPNTGNAATVIHVRDQEPAFVQGLYGEMGAWNGP